jgi:hypothetical protein
MKHFPSKVCTVFALCAAAACGSDQATTPPLPPKITIVSGNNQTALLGRPLPLPLVVQVTTADGSPAANEAIDWRVVDGGGSFTSLDGFTNAQGVASAEWFLGPAPGQQTVVAARVGSGLGVQFVATATAPPIPPPPPPQILGMRYDGTAWTAQLVDTTPFGGPVMMDAVWGSSASDVFAVGHQCYATHFDGTGWSALQPVCNSLLSNIISIDGNASSDVYAIQRFNKVPGPPYYQSRILHYNGQGWDSVYHYPIGSPWAEMRAIATRSPTDVIAVADSGYVVRYDGTNWTISNTGAGKSLRGVWADKTSPAVFAVGDQGTILYYDGSTWTGQASGTTTQLEGVWGSSRSNVYAVGWGGVLLHYDGSAWAAINSGTTAALLAISGTGGNSVYVVGYDIVLHYDGASWKSVTLPTPMRFRGVWAGQGYMYAVGCQSSSGPCWPD